MVHGDGDGAEEGGEERVEEEGEGRDVHILLLLLLLLLLPFEGNHDNYLVYYKIKITVLNTLHFLILECLRWVGSWSGFVVLYYMI